MSNTQGLRYLIIGAGGTGGAVGSHMARAGYDVTFIARGRHLEAMRAEGLRVIRPDEEFTVRPVQAYTEDEYMQLHTNADGVVSAPDVIIVCVKGYSVDDIIPFIRQTAGPGTIVIPILNIYGTGAKMQEKLPDITVTDGCIYVASEIKAPGLIWMNGTILRVVFGLRHDQRDELAADPDGPMAKSYNRLLQVEKDLNDSGIRGILTDNIERDAMRKFSYVSPQGACGLYYDAPAGEICKQGEMRDCFAGLVGEIAMLAEAMGIGFEKDVVTESLNIIDHLAPDMTTSLQRDIAAGRESEIDGLIYEVIRLEHKYGVTLPLYEKITAELKRRGL